MRIAVDFDGTCVEHAFPEVGEDMPGAVKVLKELKAAGHILLLWTCREDYSADGFLTQAKHWAIVNGIEFDGFNEDPNNPFTILGKDGKHQRKIYADVYIDDRNIGGFIGWNNVRKKLL